MVTERLDKTEINNYRIVDQIRCLGIESYPNFAPKILPAMAPLVSASPPSFITDISPDSKSFAWIYAHNPADRANNV